MTAALDLYSRQPHWLITAADVVRWAVIITGYAAGVVLAAYLVRFCARMTRGRRWLMVALAAAVIESEQTETVHLGSIVTPRLALNLAIVVGALVGMALQLRDHSDLD